MSSADCIPHRAEDLADVRLQYIMMPVTYSVEISQIGGNGRCTDTPRVFYCALLPSSACYPVLLRALPSRDERTSALVPTGSPASQVNHRRRGL